eukprot:s650_g22.t1
MIGTCQSSNVSNEGVAFTAFPGCCDTVRDGRHFPSCLGVAARCGPKRSDVNGSDAKNVALSLLAQITPRKHAPATAMVSGPVRGLPVGMVEVQRGAHTCLRCGNVLPDSELQLYRSDDVPAAKKVQVQRNDFQMARLRAINAKAMTMHLRLERWKMALDKLCGQLKLQDAIRDSAFRLERHKLLGCACLVVAASKHNVGVTLEEVSLRCDVKANLLQKMIWKVCKETGERRERRGLVEPTLQAPQHQSDRTWDSHHVSPLEPVPLQHLPMLPGGVCAYGCKLVSIAGQGWVCTGRKWSFIVAAAFMLAAEAFFYLIEVEDVARFLGIGAGTIELRVKEIKGVLLSVMQHLPWGHMIELSNVHVYLPFALEHWDVLYPAAPVLRKQQIESQQRRQKALELVGDVGEGAAPSAPARPNVPKANVLMEKGALQQPWRIQLLGLTQVAKNDEDASVRLAALDALCAVAGEGDDILDGDGERDFGIVQE